MFCLFTIIGKRGETQGAIKSFKWLPWHFIICRSERPKLQIAIEESLRVGVAHRPTEGFDLPAKDSGELKLPAVDHGIPEQCIWLHRPLHLYLTANLNPSCDFKSELE